MKQDTHLTEWLLQQNSPSLRFRTLKEIEGRPGDDPDVIVANSEIPASPDVRKLLEAMHPDGYWLQKKPGSGTFVGDGVDYGSFASTHFCLSYLAELGLDRSHPQVAMAANRYLALQKQDGDWLGHYSCLIGYNIRTFVLLGYGNDECVQRSVDYMLRTNRPDGGYLCEIHEKRSGRKKCKSCVRGAAKALLAFAELPATWDHPRVLQLIHYFLDRGGVFNSGHPDLPVNQDMVRPSFPITWRANTWEVLYALAKMGFGQYPALQRAWDLLVGNEDNRGRQRLFWTPTECPWKVGPRGEANSWLTFYAILARKFRNTAFNIHSQML